MKVDIDLDFSELDKKVREVLKNFPEAGEQCINKACIIIENKAKENCPVDLGTLRESITHKAINNGKSIEGYIFTKEEYAPHVEFGTGIYADNGQGRQSSWVFVDKDGNFHRTEGQPAKKFLSKALQTEKEKVAEEFKRFLDYV